MSSAPSSRPTSPVRSPPGCPDDATFAQLIEGTLPVEKLRELQAHSDECARCGRALAELARTLAPDAGEWLEARYHLLEPLGAGGMGVVYAALDTKLQRKVAIKRLRETAGGAPSERRRARFLREAQLLASLSHPNVLTVHDVGGSGGELYVVMELVDGWPMSQWIARTTPRPSWREIVDLYRQVATGLSAAHRLGVVHRDIKPENILVARSGRVLIGDFGLAGLMDARETGVPAGADAAPLTQTGTILGTPAYMAPELHDGKPSDALSDQFSFCVSLYESLHGRRPFVGDTTAELAAAARNLRIPLGRDGVPRGVDSLLATGLAADPRRRHRSMDELAVRLAQAAFKPVLRTWLGAGVLAFGVVAASGTLVWRAVARDEAPLSGRVAAVQAQPPEPAPGTLAPERGARTSEALGAKTPVVGKPPSTVPRTSAAVPVRRVVRGATSRPQAPAGARPGETTAAHVPDTAPSMPGAHGGVSREEVDPLLLLYLADGAHAERDGAACLAPLDRIGAGAWPAALAEHALRRRATCEMLRGNCEKGRRMLVPLDGAEGARRASLDDCPVSAFTTADDRLLALAAQADQVRYAGNLPARRKELKRSLLHETASAEVQTCLREGTNVRGCGQRLALLARAYQIVAESFLAAGDCHEGALLDVMHSQVRFQRMAPDQSEAALRCRAGRVFEAYKSCAAAGEAAERLCVAHVQTAPRHGAMLVVPDLAR